MPKNEILLGLKERGIQNWLSVVIEQLTPEQLVELSKDGALTLIFDREELDLDYLKKLESEMYYPVRFSKVYHSGLQRDEAREALAAVVFSMKAAEITRVSRNELQAAANQRVAVLRNKGVIGEYYRITSLRYPRLMRSWDQPVILSERQQKEINSAFTQSRDYPITDPENELIRRGSLTLEEVYELRGLRKATQVFERSTFLNGIPRGGLWNNLKTELMGGNRQLCVHCEQTYRDFVQRLIDIGLMKHFITGQQMKRDWTIDDKHVALEIVNTTRGIRFVLDAWHEDGGNAAHIVSVDDWQVGNDFNDIVRLIPD